MPLGEATNTIISSMILRKHHLRAFGSADPPSHSTGTSERSPAVVQGLVGSIATNQQNKSNKKQAGRGEVEAVHTRKLQPWGQRDQIQDELGDTFLENSDSLLTRFLCWFQAAPQGSRLHWQGPTQSMRSPHRWSSWSLQEGEIEDLWDLCGNKHWRPLKSVQWFTRQNI